MAGLLQIAEKDRRAIKENGLRYILSKSVPMSFGMYVIAGLGTLILPGAAYFVLGRQVNQLGINPLILPLVAFVVSIVILIWFLRWEKKERKNRPIYVDELVENLNQRYGDANSIFKQVEDEIEKGTTNLISDVDYLTQTWFVRLEDIKPNMFKVTEIAAIVGLMNVGTFIIIEDGQVIRTAFGSDIWGATFNLFKERNSLLLSNNDRIVLDDGGRAISVGEAVKNGSYDLVVAEYKRINTQGS